MCWLVQSAVAGPNVKSIRGPYDRTGPDNRSSIKVIRSRSARNAAKQQKCAAANVAGQEANVKSQTGRPYSLQSKNTWR